jgi:hypothetical protein
VNELSAMSSGVSQVGGITVPDAPQALPQVVRRADGQTRSRKSSEKSSQAARRFDGVAGHSTHIPTLQVPDRVAPQQPDAKGGDKPTA